MKTSDRVVAFALALIVGGMAYYLAFPGFSPATWTDLAVAAGARPPASIFPGLWQLCAAGIVAAFGSGVLFKAMPIAGCAMLGVIAGAAYLSLSVFLSFIVKIYPRHQRRMAGVLRMAATFGALAFATSDTLWQAAQAGSPLVLHVFLIALAAAALASFALSGRAARLYFAALLGGVLSAETPYAALLTLVGAVVYWLVEQRIYSASPTLQTRKRTELVRWKATFLYLIGLLATVGGIIALFVKRDGLDVNAISSTRLAISCLSGWVDQLAHAATPVGWLFASIIVVIPFGLAMFLARRATDEELFFPYRDGLLYCVVSLLALSQLSVLSELWMWNWTERTLISSHALRLVLVAFAAVTLTIGLTVMGVYTFCRAHEASREEVLDYGEDPGGIHLVDGTKSHRRRATGRFLIATLVLLALLGGLVGDRAQVRLHEERALLEAYLDEVMFETEGCADIFTDGRFDDALRLRALMAGRPLIPRGLYLPTTPLNSELLAKGIKRGETELAARQNAATYLRTLVRNFPEDIAASAFQVGFEQWRRDLRESPPVGGLVARPSWPAGMREKSVLVGRALADRVLAYYTRFGGGNGGDRETFDFLETMQWRLARLAVVRAQQQDLAGDVAGARSEKALAEKLDACNASLQRIQADVIKAERQCLRNQTPREALSIALRKADFALAKFYAEQVLVRDPTNRPANFAMGMALAEKGEHAQAVRHLALAIAPGSKDPVLYNNLAMAQLAVGEFAAARTNAQKAVALAPKVAAVRDTLRRIDEGEKAAATNRAPAELRLKAGPGARKAPPAGSKQEGKGK